MSKQKKKRDKKYSGKDASSTKPNITRVQAVSRSKAGQWLYDNKRMLKTSGIILLVIVVLIFIISGVISIFSGN